FMRKIFLVIILVALSLQVRAFEYFNGTYNEALVQAKQENKLVLLYFCASWCAPCRYMDKHFFTDEYVEKKIRVNYIFLKLDIDNPSSKIIYKKYNQDGRVSVPRFFFVNSEEEVIKKQESATILSFFKDFITIPEWNNHTENTYYDEDTYEYEDPYYDRPSGFSRFMRNTFYRGWKLGVNGGVNYNYLQSSGVYQKYNGLNFGYHFGLSAMKETRYFMFEPQLNFYRKGGKNTKRDENIKLNYIELPIKMSVNVLKHNIGRRQPIRLNVEPYFACAFSGKIQNYRGTENVRFGSSADKFNRFDYGVKVGASMRLGWFEPSLGYDFGLNNLSNVPNGKSYNRGFYFNVAVIFGR
ncbi:MAG: thioredoxin family protein, partial [Flavobacteriaceae bacterium]|nr:thioredoxin family protein [Flavobacteriaceae bacterium]